LAEDGGGGRKGGGVDGILPNVVDRLEGEW